MVIESLFVSVSNLCWLMHKSLTTLGNLEKLLNMHIITCQVFKRSFVCQVA